MCSLIYEEEVVLVGRGSCCEAGTGGLYIKVPLFW